jgi:hypothetical protein
MRSFERKAHDAPSWPPGSPAPRRADCSVRANAVAQRCLRAWPGDALRIVTSGRTFARKQLSFTSRGSDSHTVHLSVLIAHGIERRQCAIRAADDRGWPRDRAEDEIRLAVRAARSMKREEPRRLRPLLCCAAVAKLVGSRVGRVTDNIRVRLPCESHDVGARAVVKAQRTNLSGNADRARPPAHKAPIRRSACPLVFEVDEVVRPCGRATGDVDPRRVPPG